MRIQVQLKRVLDIMLRINESKYGWTISELSRRYEVSSRTIRRDLETLSQLMLVHYKEDEKRWYRIGNKTVASIRASLIQKGSHHEAS